MVITPAYTNFGFYPKSYNILLSQNTNSDIAIRKVEDIKGL
jgi:hypothetical protein